VDTDGEAEAVYVVGSYAYLATDGELLVIDVSNPKSPQFLGCADLVDVFSVYVVDNGYIRISQRSISLYIAWFQG